MVPNHQILLVGLVGFAIIFLTACTQPQVGPQAKMKAELPVAATLTFE